MRIWSFSAKLYYIKKRDILEHFKDSLKLSDYFFEVCCLRKKQAILSGSSANSCKRYKILNRKPKMIMAEAATYAISGSVIGCMVGIPMHWVVFVSLMEESAFASLITRRLMFREDTSRESKSL